VRLSRVLVLCLRPRAQQPAAPQVMWHAGSCRSLPSALFVAFVTVDALESWKEEEICGDASEGYNNYWGNSIICRLNEKNFWLNRNILISKKIRQLLYRHGERPWGFQEVEAPRISRQSAHEGGKVVSTTHRPTLPAKKYSWYSFLLKAESTPGP
jgi:hypothetical protein